MTRLPQPGADDGQWGEILNDFLSQSHNPDGSLKTLSQSQILNLVSDLAGKVNATGLDAATAALVNDGSSTTASALRTNLVLPLPTTGSFTYNADGTIATDPDGNSYTWNTDGTLATQTKGGVTRTFHWNTDGSLGSVS